MVKIGPSVVHYTVTNGTRLIYRKLCRCVHPQTWRVGRTLGFFARVLYNKTVYELERALAQLIFFLLFPKKIESASRAEQTLKVCS